jgi:hypothetical protein
MKKDRIRAGMEIHKQANICCLSAFPAGLARKDGDALLHLFTFTLRTRSFGLAMLGNALNERKFLFTALAFIFVCGHVLLLIISFQTPIPRNHVPYTSTITKWQLDVMDFRLNS